MAAVRPAPSALLGAAAALAIGLAGCGGTGESEPSTTTRGSGVTTTSTTEVEPTGEGAAVLEAYAQSWLLYDDFLNGEATGDPAEYFDGELLASLNARIVEFAEGGYELRGVAQLSPSDISVDGSLARLTDCQLDGTYAVVADTEEVVVPASTRPQLVEVRLVKADGQWKVSSANYGSEGSCVR